MTDYVRVRDTVTGHHITVAAALAGRHPKRYAVLRQDATDADGRPLPPKYRAVKATTQADTEATTTEATEEATK